MDIEQLVKELFETAKKGKYCQGYFDARTLSTESIDLYDDRDYYLGYTQGIKDFGNEAPHMPAYEAGFADGLAKNDPDGRGFRCGDEDESLAQ